MYLAIQATPNPSGPAPATTAVLTMNPLLWIGFGFVAAIVLFFMLTIYLPPKKSPLTRKTMHFLTALCGGLAGGFLTGGALLDVIWTKGTGKVSLSATAGFALAILVWWGYGKIPEDQGINVDDTATIDIPSGWTFKSVVDSLITKLKAGVEYVGFSDQELNAELKPQQLKADGIIELLTSLRSVTMKQTIRPYKVKKSKNVYQLKI
jgi:hypothetical protein